MLESVSVKVSGLGLGLLARLRARTVDVPYGHGAELHAVRTAMNNRLRTGADKGNPTV